MLNKGKSENVLASDDRPLFFAVDNARYLGFALPPVRRDVAVRTFVRSLAGMQKEALITSTASSRAWRLASDEGLHLNGHDAAPFPLAFLNGGMLASYMNEIVALAEQRGVQLDDLRLTLDNYYSREGSFMRGTMVGGALPPELTVQYESPADASKWQNLTADAVGASPMSGLLRGEHASRFTLSVNGYERTVGRVAPLDRDAEPDAGPAFDDLSVDGPGHADELMIRTATAEQLKHVRAAGWSPQADQKGVLHVRGSCTVRDDGVKEIHVRLLRPIGSSFRFLSDEPVEAGGGGRAPDAATLISAGVGFCFMTQLGRYASIIKKQLDRYRIAQDTHFTFGGASGGTGTVGEADSVETHVYLDTREGDDFARAVLDMGEQTCFLHALCRTPLKTKLRLSEGMAADVTIPATGPVRP